MIKIIHGNGFRPAHKQNMFEKGGQFEMKKAYWVFIMLLLVSALLLIGREGVAADTDKKNFPGPTPKMITMSALPIKTIATIGTANMSEYLLKAEGTNIRFVPLATGLARVAPVRSGSIDMVAGSNAMVYYQWGLREAADRAWGPQPLRLTAVAMRPEGGLGMATNKPDKYKSYKDITRKTKIAQVPGMAFWNTFQKIIIAWNGLTLDDMDSVKIYPALSAAVRGFKAGEFDIIGLGLIAPVYLELEGTGDLHFIKNPPCDDPKTTKLMYSLADPYRTNYRACGFTGPLGISKDKPYPTLGYPNPLIAAYPQKDKSLVYHFTRMVCEHWKEYVDLYPLVLQGYSLKNQLGRPYNFPWHEGAVAYFKQVGAWTDKMEARNQKLIQLQEEMKELWKQTTLDADKKGVPKKEWQEFWLKRAVPYVNNYMNEHIYPLW